MKLLRAFPRKTNATPDDENVRIGMPGLFDECDEVHISVAFDADKDIAESMAYQWERVADKVKLGGVAYDDPGGESVPGMYIKHGYTITSRGCPNKCWFCQAWKNEGDIRELEIKHGYNVLDNNLLACSKDHQRKVFEMLLEQDEKPRFTGGFEAKRFSSWHCNWLDKLSSKVCWFAYDTSDDYEPLAGASDMLRSYDLLKNNVYCCYVLIGYPKDTIQDAEKRLNDTVKLGLFPQAMLYDEGNQLQDKQQWKQFQREWANKIIVGSKMRVTK